MIQLTDFSIKEFQIWNTIETLCSRIVEIENNQVRFEDYASLYDKVKLLDNKDNYAQQMIGEIYNKVDDMKVQIENIESESSKTNNKITVLKRDIVKVEVKLIKTREIVNNDLQMNKLRLDKIENNIEEISKLMEKLKI